MNLMNIANVFMHAYVAKEDIWHSMRLRSTQTIKFIWLILSTMRQNGDIVLDMSEFCYFCYLFFTW